MSAKLDRDLGLLPVITISMGAMIGSGIFVLPGIAATIAGPAVILAYLLAGLIVLPTALSKAEMSTAMPESGGAYIYIDRALGPAFGTVAGLGVWFSLVFKSAFALVGLGAYLLIYLPDFPTKLVGLAIGALLIAVNCLGAKQSGGVQAVIVVGVLAVLALFVGVGVTQVESVNYEPFFSHGWDGVLKATGFVFVSYAGVTKIASVAEEVDNPGRNLPMGMLASIAIMLVVYVASVFVVVGVISPSEIGKSLTPMSDASAAFMGTPGTILLTVTAVLALTGMANAGILSSSRYPFAMSRDRLAPDFLSKVNDRFQTPVASILLTGGVLLTLIAFVPVTELAKLASAFVILGFILNNVALIVFRTNASDDYQPSFRSPLYPWVQIFGIVSGLALLTFMGAIALGGAAFMIAAGIVWYYAYARKRTTRVGAGVDILERQADDAAIAEAEEEGETSARALIPIGKTLTLEREEELIHLTHRLMDDQDGRIDVMRIDHVPEQLDLGAALAPDDPATAAFEKETGAIADRLHVRVRAGEIVTHNPRHAIISHVTGENADLLVGELGKERRSRWQFSKDKPLDLGSADCNSVLVHNALPDKIEAIGVLARYRPIDPVKMTLAERLAKREGAKLVIVHVSDTDIDDDRRASLQEYHDKLAESLSVPCEGRITTSDAFSADSEAYDGFDAVMVNASQPGFARKGRFGPLTDSVIDNAPCLVLVVNPETSSHGGLLQRLLQKVIN